MGQPAAKQGDQVTATDTHLIQPPGPTSPIPVPHPFTGLIDGGLSGDVNLIQYQPRYDLTDLLRMFGKSEGKPATVKFSPNCPGLKSSRSSSRAHLP